MSTSVIRCGVCGQTDSSMLVQDSTRKYVTCMNCSATTRIAPDDTHVYHHVEGIPTVDGYLLRADQLLADRDLDGASKAFKEALRIDPTCYQAWWGRFCCERAFAAYYGYQDSYGNSGPAVKARIILNNVQTYAQRAAQYAPAEIAETYLAVIDRELQMARSSASAAPAQKDKRCYIATAVYGSSEMPQVLRLRRFRDEALMPRAVGRAFVKAYYRLSPPLATHLTGSSAINRLVRSWLDALVRRLDR